MTTNPDHPTPWKSHDVAILDANGRTVAHAFSPELAARIVAAVNAMGAPPTREQTAEGPPVAESPVPPLAIIAEFQRAAPDAFADPCVFGHHDFRGDECSRCGEQRNAEPAEAGEPGDEELRTLYCNASRVYAGTPLHGHADYPHLGYRALFDHGRAFERERLQSRLTEAEAARDGVRALLGELLARIHRDGGHYTLEHGLAKSTADADKAWLQLESDLAAARGRLALYKQLEAAIRFPVKYDHGDPVHRALDALSSDATGGEAKGPNG